MVEEIEKYVCEVCGMEYESKQEAERCESKDPRKISLGSSTPEKGLTSEWQNGDLVAHHRGHYESVHGELRFGRIVGRVTENHTILPVFYFLDRRETEAYRDLKHGRITVLQEGDVETMKGWLEERE